MGEEGDSAGSTDAVRGAGPVAECFFRESGAGCCAAFLKEFESGSS